MFLIVIKTLINLTGCLTIKSVNYLWEVSDCVVLITASSERNGIEMNGRTLRIRGIKDGGEGDERGEMKDRKGLQRK